MKNLKMNNWINIKEKSPDALPSRSIYIVTMYNHYKHKRFVEPLHYIADQWFTMVDEDPLDIEYEVTHYMSLPEPPDE